MPPQLPYMLLDTNRQEAPISSPQKIATCCYCGTRAALVLKGQQRHELSCSSCGAPLHNLKMMPKRKVSDAGSAKYDGGYKKKKQKKKKSMFSRVMDEAWDAIEDIFD
ncbi:hypothetical protein RUM8411_00690 [Ruegeria meonggei]|uniref:Uncharacterized protein n=2 Tax=Ruegeria meonggei TaxID=1446476 RepID=A0A1X6YFH4_9RHOB|nr:hypothetical protein RUM8411_00690 [Ruegeria meonggei]